MVEFARSAFRRTVQLQWRSAGGYRIATVGHRAFGGGSRWPTSTFGEMMTFGPPRGNGCLCDN